MNRFPLNALRHFYFVAKQGGFSRASSVLRVRQPSISKMVRQLEAELGVKLLQRGRQGAEMTPIGESVFRECQAIANAIANIRILAETKSVQCSGDLRIGVTDHVASHLLPPVVTRLGSLHPDLIPRIIAAPSHVVCRNVMEGELEVGMLLTIPPDSGLDCRNLMELSHRVVIAAELQSDRRIQARFIGSRELNDEANRSFPTVEMLQRSVPETAIVISSNNIETHRRLVLEGAGVAVLPEFMIEEDIRSGRLVVLHPSYRYTDTLKLISKPSRPRSNGAKALIDCFDALYPAATSASSDSSPATP